MEITVDTLISLAGLFIGGGGGAFFTWRYMRRKAKAEAQTEEVNMAQAVQDTYQQMLKDREEEVAYKNGIIKELRERQEKMESTVFDLKREVARNGRMVEAMRPFLCYDTKCKKRVRVPQSEYEEPEKPAKLDVEPLNSDAL